MHTSEIRMNMQKIMQNNAAVFRTEASLVEGCKLMDKACDSFSEVNIKDKGMVWYVRSRPQGRSVKHRW